MFGDIFNRKMVSPQFGVGGMIYWLFGKPIHAPVKEKIDCEQNSNFALDQWLKVLYLAGSS